MTCPHPRSRKTEKPHEWECRQCGVRYIHEPKTLDFSGVMTPVKKRGSSKCNSDPTVSHVLEAVRETKQRLGRRFTRGAAEREIWRHSAMARSQKKFAELQGAGRQELQKLMDPKQQPHFTAAPRSVDEKSTPKGGQKSRGGNRE
jgi:hypothetical protein